MVSDLQSNVKVTGNRAISGRLKYVTDYTGFSGNPEMQKGNFLAVKFSDLDPDATSVKVGIEPGTPLVDIIPDPDKNGVFRILNPATNKLVVESSDGTNTKKQVFDLSGLTLEPAPTNEEVSG